MRIQKPLSSVVKKIRCAQISNSPKETKTALLITASILLSTTLVFHQEIAELLRLKPVSHQNINHNFSTIGALKIDLN